MERLPALKQESCKVGGLIGYNCNKEKTRDPKYCLLDEQLARENPDDPAYASTIADAGGMAVFLRTQNESLDEVVGCPNTERCYVLMRNRVRKHGSDMLKRKLGIK